MANWLFLLFLPFKYIYKQTNSNCSLCHVELYEELFWQDWQTFPSKKNDNRKAILSYDCEYDADDAMRYDVLVMTSSASLWDIYKIFTFNMT